MHMTLFQILAVLRDGPLDAGVALERLSRLAPAREVPSVPSFYRHLRRGLEEGWITVQGTTDDEGPGRPAQSYALTPDGLTALQDRSRELEAFTRLALETSEGRGG